MSTDTAPALPGLTSPDEYSAERRSRGDDPTPRGVVRAVLETVALSGVFDFDGLGDDTLKVLDVCAGYGCWASEMRRLAEGMGWPVHITGVELDERKREHLARWCDAVVIRDWRDALASGREYACLLSDYVDGADIAIGNPDFAQLLDGDPARSMPAVLLDHMPAVLLLHTQQAFIKSEAGRAARRLNPPAASWLVPGSVQFRRGINPKNGKPWGADQRCYQVTLWLRGHTGPCSTYLLDDLTPSERSWTRPPGTEDAREAEALGLPMAPR